MQQPEPGSAMVGAAGKSSTPPPHEALVALLAWLDRLDVAGRCGRVARSVARDFADGALAAEAVRLELLRGRCGFVPCLPVLCKASGREQMRCNWLALERLVLRPGLHLTIDPADIEAVVSFTPNAAERVLISIQDAVAAKVAGRQAQRVFPHRRSGSSGHGRPVSRDEQCEDHAEDYLDYLHGTKLQRRRRRRRRQDSWRP